ncbi:winged helix-turn-helix transcriptional regulator [Aureivirga marina]|uniref:winged helix-turn-helix transcriptional regulator n=1 Tax=Aureivirga marina TaxID=1182451 RepID=UPI0018C94CA9|nr:helix-turn-helix domain-containing protein [Aureivirga marina]
MEDFFRCKCPITSSLDIFGDKWTLVIVKQMLFEEKSTFKDFTESEEAIATNILSSRLKMLEKFGLIEKENHPNNKKTNIYTLTEKALSFTPILIELMIWSKENIQEFHPNLNIHPDLNRIKKNKENAASQIVKSYNQFKKSLFKN